MRFPVIALLVSATVLSACGGSLRESRINPANWFGRSTSVATEQGKVVTADGRVEEVNPLIGARKQSQIVAANQPKAAPDSERISIFNKKDRPYEGTLVDQVTALVVERTSTGAIVRAEGVSSRQGAFDVRLIPTNEGRPVDGVLTYELKALQPLNTPQGPPRTRQLKAGAPLTLGQLEKIRTVQVVARRNTRTTRR